jgi:coenzyme PQQ synthesis protein D (PqqD)
VSARAPTRRIGRDFVALVPETIAWVDVDGEAVLYDEIRQQVHVLSATATLVWRGMDGKTSLDRIARDLSESFGTDLALVRSDVLDLARDLARKGLIAAARPRSGSDSTADVPEESGRGQRSAPRFLEDPPGG